VLLREVDENIGIARADRRRGAVGQVDAAVGQAQIVHDGGDLARFDGLAERLLHLVAKNRGLLDARPRGGAQVQLELPGVDAREEILAQAGHRADRKREESGCGHGEQEDAGEHQPAVDGEAQEIAITVTRALEAVLEALLEARQARFPLLFVLVFFLQPVFGERGDEGSRQDVGSEHGEHDRFRERNEQVLRDARQLKHRHEHDADRKRGHQGGQRDLLCAFQDRLLDVAALLQMIIDVLDGNGRIIDQDADRQRETAQGHDVDGFP
jgi:hypothetical protein